MQKTIQLASNLLKNSGLNETYLPQVKLFINETTTEKMPLLYKQGIIFVLQGEKCIYEQSNKIIYNKENMLVLTVPMPLSCKAFALDNKPIISMLMDIETSMLNQLIDSMEHTKTLEKIDKGNIIIEVKILFFNSFTFLFYWNYYYNFFFIIKFFYFNRVIMFKQ